MGQLSFNINCMIALVSNHEDQTMTPEHESPGQLMAVQQCRNWREKPSVVEMAWCHPCWVDLQHIMTHHDYLSVAILQQCNQSPDVQQVCVPRDQDGCND